VNVELMQKLGNMDQIAGIRETELSRGPGKGLALVEVYNAAGLRFSLLPDRCLDIYDFSYKGLNLSFHAKNGLRTGRDPAEDEFFHQWTGGMLTTCGLANVGGACVDDGVHPIHGRVGSTPARHVSVSEGWQGDDYILSVSGEVFETRLYGRVLSLRRTISIGLFDKAITIEDTISNENAADEALMLLYHINFGYPLLDARGTVVCSHDNVRPYGDNAKEHARMCAPGAEPPHQLFVLTTRAGHARAAVVNAELSLAGFVAYNTENLPYLCEWKHMAAHDYVVALEPCNCLILGRIGERENGTLRTLPAYSSITNSLTLGVLDGGGEIEAFTNAARAIT